MMEDRKIFTKKEEKPPGKTACLYLSSIVLVAVAICSLSLLRLLISICHYEYTNGRTVCAPQSVVLHKLPVEIPSRTLFLRVGGLEYDASSDSFNSSLEDDLGRHTEHNLELIHRSNFSRFKDLKELSLIKCGVKTIQKMAFSDLVKLKKLDLRFNKITFLDKHTFFGLNLTVLDLSHNLMVTLSAFAFSGSRITYLFLANSTTLKAIDASTFANTSFEHVHIDNSQISVITTDLLLDLSISLKSFTITHQQTPLDLAEDLFHNHTHLQHLNLYNASLLHVNFLKTAEVEAIILDHNDIKNATEYYSDPEGTILHVRTRKLSLASGKLSSLPSFFVHSYKQLSNLDLSSNKFVTIDASIFSQLADLEVLDLSRNNISTLTNFNNHTIPSNLSSLYLHSNNIRTLSHETYPLISKLEKFTFQDNVLHCNCEVKWLADFIMEKEGGGRIVKDWNRINCSTPLNISIVEVKEDDFVCTPPSGITTSHKEVVDEKGVVLACEVSSDPASNITWSNDLKQDHNTSHIYPNILNIFKITHNYSNNSSNNKSTSGASNRQKISLEVLVFVDEYTTRSQLFVSSSGNYTCHASNIVATTNHTFNTHQLPLTAPHFNRGAEKTEVMSSFEGALLAAILLILIGLLIKRDSNTFDQLS